jgi:cellulose synthase/poly-beta-1,6-N-acetylglucosamine synthase-like glycosyltransferase
MDKGDVVGVAGTYVTLNPEYRIADFIGLDIEYRHLQYGDYTNFAGSYNAGLKKSILDELGGFDESFKDANAEDNDLSYRILDGGYKIAYAPNAWVKHPHPTSLTHFVKQQFKRATWRIFLYKRRPKWVKGDRYAGFGTLFQPILFAGLFLVALVALVFNPIWVPLILVLAVLGLIGLNLPFISWACRKRRVAFAILASGLIIIRVISWCTGAVYGIAKFLIADEATTKVEDMG